MSDISDAKILRIVQKRSQIGCTQRQRDTLRGLGLSHLGKTVVRNNSPSLQGMLRAVSHLIEVRDHESK